MILATLWRPITVDAPSVGQQVGNIDFLTLVSNLTNLLRKGETILHVHGIGPFVINFGPLPPIFKPDVAELSRESHAWWLRPFRNRAARLAHAAGIARVTVAEVFVHGPDAERKLVSVETSTPKARAFVAALLDSPVLSRTDYTLTSREVRSIVDDEPLSSLTVPMSEPFTDVIQDLWQLGHVTASYVARALAGAILLATGIIDDNPVAIVVAALFLPFLAQVLAVSFGMWNRDRCLIVQGLRALLVSTGLRLRRARSSAGSKADRSSLPGSKAR